MSPGWREMVKFAMTEANRLGLKMSINLANTGGSLRGPWDMKNDGPKQLIWTASSVTGSSNVKAQLVKPDNKKYFQDVALMAVRTKSTDNAQKNKVNLNGEWKTVVPPSQEASSILEIIDLKDKVSNGTLKWDAPEGNWRIIRFGYHVIGEEGSVDILNPEAVTKYFHLMGSELMKDAGPLSGVTLTHFYNVSWEGGQPDWTTGFEKDFFKYRGYDISQYMPILTGMSPEDHSVNERFMHDYFRTVSDCFKHNCYETIGALCHDNGIQWHSEDGGPWPRKAPMFKEADQFSFWGRNDMPQGEFWCSGMNDLTTRSNVRYTAMAGHTYGHPLIAVEAFTHMGQHWTKYPAYLKPFADINLIDGANFFIWQTFTASPIEIGKPGYEYFAGTHINPRLTWWNQAGSFVKYLGRSQYLLRKGDFVADVCCYVSDKNYTKWGRGEKWNQNSSLAPVNGFTYDLLSSEVLTDKLSVENGRLVLPDGMSYKVLVVDLIEPVISVEVLKKITELVKNGATVVLGQSKPVKTPGIGNYPECDKNIMNLSNELWSKTTDEMLVQKMGKGTICIGTNMEDILKENKILPDFEGPFEYIHRTGNNQDIYFISGEGKAECTFRTEGRKPEIWDPVSGQINEAISYRFTNDGRTTVPLNLPENGSVFVIFREIADQKHITSVKGPDIPELIKTKENSSQYHLWKTGNYSFSTSDGDTKNITAKVELPLELTDSWDITFAPATEAEIFKTSMNKLILWNEHSNPDIKYFSGTASYEKKFTLTAEEANSAASRLYLGEVHDISEVTVNGKNMGIIWTSPWIVNLSGVLKEGTNELKIEVTNCWANRLIGDAGLPEEKWTTKTNVRRVPDRSEYKRGHQAFSAQDELMPSGLVGPVFIKFGINSEISF